MNDNNLIGTTVWVLTVTTKHGTYMSVHTSELGAQQNAASFATDRDERANCYNNTSGANWRITACTARS